jgi:hypothetical protein
VGIDIKLLALHVRLDAVANTVRILCIIPTADAFALDSYGNVLLSAAERDEVTPAQQLRT